MLTGSSRLKWILWLYIGLALVPWTIILLASSRGFDLTDESFYLMNYAHPEDVAVTFSTFSVVGKLLYDLCGGNVAALRSLGALIWLGIASGVAWVTFRFLSPRQLRQVNPTAFSVEVRFLLTLLVSSGGALYYTNWLLTPSYNLIALAGLALFWAGFLLWIKSDCITWVNRLGAALFAFAALLVFWSKASSAALLLIFPLAALLVHRSAWRRLLSLQTVTWGIGGFSLGVALPLFQGISPQQVVESLIKGIEHQQILKPGQYSNLIATILDGFGQLIEFFSGNPYLLRFAPYWLLPLVAVVLVARQSGQRPIRGIRRVRILLGAGWMTNVILVSYLLPDSGYWALNIFLLIVAFLTVGHYAQRKLMRSTVRSRWYRMILWTAVIFTFIFIFLFGTSNSYAAQSAMGTYFFLLGTAVLFLGIGENTLNATLLRLIVPTLLLAIAYLTYFNSLTPYRQDEPVWMMDDVVSIRGESVSLMVSEETARYLTEL